MAASLLEENLRSLHAILAENASQKEQAVGIVSDLTQICVQEITDKEIDLTCSSLFDKDYGLTFFLSKAITNDELQLCKSKVLEFLSEFIDKVGQRILPYAVDVKDICVSLFSRDRYAKVKNAAMPVLCKLLELTVGSSLGKELQVDKLITKFFNELTKTTKLTSTVKEKIYILLGIIAEVYPEHMTPYADRLTGIYLGALKAEIGSKTRKPEFAIISGCLEGLSCSLVNFTESADEGSKNSYEIFKYARHAIDSKIEFTRYDVPRSGLRLFARHASQFGQYLIEDYENVYSKMSFWSHHKNSEMVLLGMKAIEAFLTQISEMLKEKAKEGKQQGGSIFKYFVCQFRDIMHNESASAKELSLAIRGYGLLAGPCKCYMKEADVQFMFAEMLTKTEQQFLGSAEELENKLFNLASYLESLASIVREMDELSDTYAQSLEQLMVLLLENIPNIHPSKHYMCRKAILWLLFAVMPKGTTFRQMLSGFVFQSLIRTCSYVPVIETENEGEVIPDDLKVKKITYKDFMETWSGLLDATLIKEFAAADISLEVRHQLMDALYNEIMTSILKVLNKLDLTSSTADGEDQMDVTVAADVEDEAGISSADPLMGVQAKRPKDFQVFINLVDFCRDLLPVKHYEKFECWVFPFTHKLILLSTDNPLASGFYKLLSVSMKIANKLNYFKDTVESSVTPLIKEESMEIDAPVKVGGSQKHTCYLLVKKFSKEVLVRMKQYRDDLLASCLTFILALPKEVISGQMSEVVPAIQVTLTLGLSYLPLAMVAMDALEFWSRSLPHHVMSPFYPSILPCLDNFLKTSDQGAEDVNVDTNINTNRSKTGKGRKKLSVRLIKGKKDSSIKSYQSQLTQVKWRIMTYLGRLGGSVNSALLSQNDTDISRKAVTWDSQQHLKFDMPFVDMKPTIYLDPFLPHVVELATRSSDRQTKVAACELLHSLVLYSIGRGAQQPGARVQRASMAALYTNLFPPMLKLACDVEQVAKQLFEPLTMQIIHWFTNNKKAESEETMALLDAIYNGMIQQSDTALRDFCARCLHEFLKWSIKQTSTKMSETNPANANSVLKRLYSYALHPSPFKRLGAALAFNNIYTVFREEESLVNMFTFQLMVHFVDSLAIAHADEKSLGTQEQCCKSLEHIEKIIRQKAAILKVPSKTRKEPKSWTSITLDIAVRWLTRQCGRPQTECRHACMKLSNQLCTLIGGIKMPVKFFQACLKGKGPEYWIQRFEGGGHAGKIKFGIEGSPTLVDASDVFSLQTTLSWFDNVLAALDCYTWVFGENLLSPGDLFAKKTTNGSKSNIFVSLEYFLKNIALVDIEQVVELFPRNSDTEFFTPKEKDDFNRAKCTMIVRLLGFLTVMLAKFKKETLAVAPKALWSSELWELICSCVVQPGTVGFNMGDVEIMKNLPQEMTQTLAVFSLTFKDNMIKHFSESLSGDRNLFSRLPIPLDDIMSDQVQLQQMLSGYTQLHEVNLLLPCLPGITADKSTLQLLENVHQGIVTKSTGVLTSVYLTPTSLSMAKSILKLAFSLGLPAENLVNCILDENYVSGGSSKTAVQLHGDLFFSMFRSAVCHYIIPIISDVARLVVKKADSEPRRVCTVLTSTVDYLSRDRELRKKEGAKVLSVILSHWPQLSGWWGKSASTDLQGMALLLVTKLLLIDSKFASTPGDKSFDHVFTMYQSMLTDTKTNLSFKCRVLELLPFFSNVPDPYNTRLKSCLDRLVADSFPLRSFELTKGSPKYNDYISALDRILSAFQLSGSLMLLEYLISIFCRETEHVHEDAIQSAIAKFTRRLPRDKQKNAVDVPYKIFTKTGSFPSEIRRATVERVCLPMLRLVSKSSLLDFFMDHIVQLKEFVEVKLSKSSEGVLEGQLVTRMCCFQLLEVMYSRLSKDEVVGTTSSINRVFCSGNVQTGKELTSFVSKQAHDAKGEDIRGETILLELRRQYHCVAYNLMVAFISRTQTELKYYTAFLFEEKEAKGQFLLENFIDKDRAYEFQVELMSPMERKKRFVSIHQEIKNKRRDEDDSYDDVSPSFHLASQYLADSSLSEDVSQYFSMSGTVGGCFYHLTQATWRRVQAEGLQSAYNNDEDVKFFCAKLDGLAFLPPNDVKDGMAIIREQATEELLCLVEYFDSNYVNGVLRAVVAANGHMRFRRSAPRFPPDIWNVHNATIQDIDRTNNQCESWNNAFKHLVGHANPSLWNVISCIGKDACMVAADVLRCDRGEPPQKRVKKATKTHQQRLKDLCLQYSLSGNSNKRRTGNKVKGNPEEEQEVEATVEEDYVELEMDALNQHESMATMIAVIKHLQENKITPEVAPGTANPPIPQWMEKLHSKMCNTRTHNNIKLFIAKLIINTTKVFQPYAIHWLRPFCQLIISGPLGSGSINYFIMDLIVTMLSWHKTAIPQDTLEEKAMASRLVHFVVKNIYHETRQVFRNNLEMLKTLLECWKSRVEIPYQEIYSQLKNVDPKSKENIVGIQVLGVVIACKFPPYGPVAPVDRERFFSKVANGMGNTHKTIYAPAAEVCGMIFHHLSEKEDENDGSFHTYVGNLMTQLHQSKPDNFITSVHRMQKHYPPIADRFMNKLLFMLPNLHGEFRTLCLEVLHGRIDQVENVFLELKSKGIMASLGHRDEATQLVSLKIVKVVLSKLKPSELTLLMPLITAFGSNPSTGCRNVMYDILMWVYDNYREEDSVEGHQIIQQTKESLLKGLGDGDLHCRLQVQNFWSSETRLPVGTLDRLVAMLEAMYSPITEQQYLSYATNLLLEMTSKSPDYQREIFELPLSECKFSDYSVKSSWRQRHAAMTPLFATQSSQSQMEVDDSVDGGIRATQDVQQFTQTQQGTHKGPFNWLTQSSLDTYADASMVSMETQSTTQSSLLFSIGTSDGDGRPSRKPRQGSGFGKQKLSAAKPSTSGTKKEEPEEGNELLRLKRRFLKDQEQSRIFFAKRQTRLKQMREAAVREQKTRRENQVTMYRKYRSGDLPDIQIKYSYIIAPLQALAHRDSTVAKLLFSAIFQAIFVNMDEVKTEREMGETVTQINTSMDNVLSLSTQYYPPFIGCVLDILYKLRTQLKIEVPNIGGSAIFSKLQPLGIVVLEEQLIQYEPLDKRAAKRGRMETPVSKDITHWIELSRLYKSVEEYDVLLGIFSGKIGTQPITQKAVHAEARGDYSTAKKLYEEAIECTDWPDGSPHEAELDLWDDCKMECLLQLSQWDQLETASTAAVDSSDQPNLCKVWEDTFWQEHFLPFILRSKVKQMLKGDENQQSLLDFVDASMKIPEQKLVLENGYSEELSLMYLWQEDYDRARHYSTSALEFFLQEWSSTDSLMSSSRSSTLQKLQPLIELQEFLHFVADENNFRSVSPAQSLVRDWNKRTPHLLTDPVTIWDDVVTNRSVYLDIISTKLRCHNDSQDSMDSDDAGDIFLDTKLRLKLRMAESCKEQNNFASTLRILRETHSTCKRSDSSSLIVDWTHLYASTHHKKIRTSLDPWAEDSLNSVITTLDQLGKIEEMEALAASPALGRHHHVLNGQGYELLAFGLQDIEMRDIEKSKVGQKLLDLTGMTRLNKLEVTEQLICEGMKKMKASLAVEDVAGAETFTEFGQDQAYLATAKYCDGILRLKEDDELQVGGSCLKSFPEAVVLCMLKAMKFESTEARQRFPRLLQIVELYPETMATFIAKSREVPCWMFILWISQMLAILDKQEAQSVHDILEQITSLYPQAVVYPLKLSQEGYKFGNSQQDKKNKAMVERLESLLTPDKVPLTDKFMAALDCFGQPDQEFKDVFDEILQLLRKKDKTKVKEKYKELYWKVLDYEKRERQEGKVTKSQSSQRSKASGKSEADEEEDQSLMMSESILDIGSYTRKFADKFKSEFDKKFGPDGSKIVSMSLKEFAGVKQHFAGLFEHEIKSTKTLQPPQKLSEYSKWMSTFNPNVYGRNLEIPGQYTGLGKPMPEYHVKVAGFDQRIIVLTSLRKPKRVTIRGNDERDYHFLVKGGEDLRQDQRIEQLFFIMNQVFNKDFACRNRKLKLKTYEVIPVTTRVGLIEWVADTKPLKNFMMDSLSEQEAKFSSSTQGPNATHVAWINKVSKAKESWGVKFANVYKMYSHTETVRQLNITESKVPWDLFRRAFQKLSTSPEAFHVLRSHCMQTHAMLCMCQYVLGIGDRHLSNFMVNMKTGEMVGIDFGHAFGSATQFLGIPELIPFRLTRQLRNLMLPLQVKGLIESTMIHVLRALRSDSDLLLNTMDIFVKEPSLDWLQNAERQMQTMTDEDVELYSQEGEIIKWYPKEKINVVKQKLKGANPAYITRDELKLGHGKKPPFKDFENVVLGQKDSCVRAQLPAHGLTVEQQVAALIDQATDPNILGRTWIGWEPWV